MESIVMYLYFLPISDQPLEIHVHEYYMYMYMYTTMSITLRTMFEYYMYTTSQKCPSNGPGDDATCTCM